MRLIQHCASYNVSLYCSNLGQKAPPFLPVVQNRPYERHYLLPDGATDYCSEKRTHCSTCPSSSPDNAHDKECAETDMGMPAVDKIPHFVPRF